MDSFSPASLDSEDSVPRNVYEEVVVDSTIQSADSKEDENSENISEATMPNAGEGASESDDNTDDEGDSNESSSTTPAPSVKGAELSFSGSSQKSSTACPEENKASNLKLVLKKSPEYQLVNPSTTQGKSASSNKIFLVTLVSNTNTSPVCETAKNPVAATNDVKASTVSVVNSAETNESLDEPENFDDSNIQVLNAASDKPIKTYSKTSSQTLVRAEELEVDSSETLSEPTKDDAEINRLESDSKPSTPKIARELQQLQKTLNESKVLSEYMNDSMGKSRKARKIIPLKGSDNEGSSPLPMRSRSRSCSKPRVDSPVDNGEKLKRWPSEEKISKRQNMRSQNSEFVQKQMKFLNSIQGEEGSDNSDGETSVTDGKSSSHSNNDSQQQVAMKREMHSPPKPGWDMFCFKCHFGAELMPCSKCIRSFHSKCVKNSSPSKTPSAWVCPECVAIENQIKSTTRIKSSFCVDNLNQLLQFALNRMKQSKGSECFISNFNEEEYPEIGKYLVHPVTLEMLQNNIEKKTYKCTEEFAVDSKWILHNCSVYFGNSSKVTNFAKGLVKVCRQEVTEIDTCPECYYNANTRKDWFVEVCSRPHMLLWAKLKGFPYWPAKSMGVNGALVNVRFFGDHDRAYVPIKECFLYSENDPNPITKQNKKTIKECIKEVDIHIRKITAKFGAFVYPPFRTIYDPSKELQQLELMIPGITESMKNAEKVSKPALTYKIVKTADNHLSIIKKDQEKIEDVVSPISTSVNNKKDDVQTTESEISQQKQRVQSTDSSHSHNEVTSTCETNVEPALNQEAPKETKSNEKTVAPMKIQERTSGTESTTKTYEVVSKINDQEQTKVNSVILKRKSDNWNAVTASTNKKSKLVPEANEISIKDAEMSSPNIENASPPASSTPTNQPIIATIKRKRSREEIPAKSQKMKLDGDKIPPLAPLTPPFVAASTTSSVTTQSTVASPVVSFPIVTSLSSSVTVTITQSPVVTSVSSKETPPPKPLPITISSVLSGVDRSEITIKRLQKKQPPAPQLKTPIISHVSSALANENVVEVVVASSSVKEKEPGVQKILAPKAIEQSAVINNLEKSPVSNGPKTVCELIPFQEIKVEKPDGIERNAELVEIRSKTTTPEQPSASCSNQPENNSEVNFRPVVVKTEIMSDDDLSNASRSEENVDGENSNSSNSKGSDMKATAKILPQSHISNQKVGDIQIKVVGKPESKKQRARKSFPNKTSFNPLTMTSTSNPIGIKRPNMPQPLLPQNNGMVYIPVDPKTSSVPINSLASTSTSSSSAAPKVIVNVSASPSTSQSLSPNPVSLHSISGMNAISSSVTPLPSTILTTSLQLPIVYSAIPIPSVNGSAAGQPNASSVQITCSVPPNTPVTSEQHMLSGFVTPTLASAITDAIVKGPPRLAPRPAGPLRSEGDYIFPTEAGPVSRMLIENAHKMTDFFRSVIEDTLSDMSKNNNLEAKVRILEIELEKMKYTHEKEIAELKHNTDLMLCEMRKSLENEKARLVADTRKQAEIERLRAVEEAKTKQWCAACGKEAQFYCCWNTSYCDYPCQQKHWSRHMNTCAQKDNTDANAQRVGVKISPYNVKEKQNKVKETAVPKHMPSNASMRAVYPAAMRNSVPAIKRLIPITTQTTPRYTLINSNESNWGLVSTPQFPRVFPTSGLVMSDGSNKTLSGSPLNMLRNQKM